MKLGDVVTIVGAYLHAGKPFVVVHEPLRGRVQVSRVGSRRWFMPEWHAVDEIRPAGDAKEFRRAQRQVAAVKPDPDGWKRVWIGRYGSDGCVVIVGHVDVAPAGEVERP